MRNRFVIIAGVIVSLLLTQPLRAQHSVVSAADLRQAMLERSEGDDARRDLVRSVLRDERVRRLVGRLSLEHTRAEQAVATLSGEDLEAAASAASAIQQDLSGEASTVTFSVTTLLLILIIVILLAR